MSLTRPNKFKPDLSSFLNPTPSNKAKLLKDKNESKHGKHAGAFLDDTGDIYDHTATYFNKGDSQRE